MTKRMLMRLANVAALVEARGVTTADAVRLTLLYESQTKAACRDYPTPPPTARVERSAKRVGKHLQRERERKSMLRGAQPPLRQGDYGYEPKRVGWDGNGQTKRFRLATGQVLSEGTRI